MQVRFIGDPNERDGVPSRRHLSLFGKDFVLDQVADVSDLTRDEKAKLARHNHFAVVSAPEPPVADETDAPAPVVRPRGGRKPAAETEE